MAPTLFHFSETPDIRSFTPRAVSVQAKRAPGEDWLNGPLVWAISDAFAFLYLFPRNCPRIVVWATDQTRPQDARRWLGDYHRVAYVQERWMGSINTTTIYRYEMPREGFTALGDVGMAVSAQTIIPTGRGALTDLPARLAENEVVLRPVPSLDSIKAVWDTSLHASGIRLRNAR